MRDEQEIKRRIDRQIARTKKRINEYKEKEQRLSAHGCWSLGYYQGKLAGMEAWLDSFDEGDCSNVAEDSVKYKIFKVTYNDGQWHSGEFPHFFYIARNEQEVISESKKYAEFMQRKEILGGSIWISEFTGITSEYEWENLDKFSISMQATPKA